MPALTAVRFPLAIWVIVHHLSGPGRMLDPLTSSAPAVQELIGGAWAALGTFFAISGFVLARRYHTTEWNRVSLTRYAIARFARIYPIYALSLVVLAPIICGAIVRQELGSGADSTGLVLNYLLILQGWTKLPVDWNTPAWSLSCEIFFYACFPAAVLLLRERTWPRLALTVMIGFSLPAAVRLIGLPLEWKPIVYFGDFFVGMAGAGIYEVLRRRGHTLRRAAWWLCGASAAGAVMLLLNTEILGSFLLFDAGIRLANATLVLGLAYMSVPRVSVVWNTAMLGGKTSYAMYILHIPLLWWYKRSPAYYMLPDLPAALVYLIIVIALSLAIARWYEDWANNLVRRRTEQWLIPRSSGVRAVPASVLEPVT